MFAGFILGRFMSIRAFLIVRTCMAVVLRVLQGTTVSFLRFYGGSGTENAY